MAVMTMERPASADGDDHQPTDDRRQRAAVVRALHDQLDPPPGWRVEIIEGELVVSPAPSPGHGYIVEIIRTAVHQSLPATHGAYEAIELAEPEEDVFIPDLSVWPRKLLRRGTERPDPTHCALAVEVTSPSQSKRDYRKEAGYARCSIPTYLLVDRSREVCILYTEPGGDHYLTRHEIPFGKPVTLPLDPPVTVETSDF